MIETVIFFVLAVVAGVTALGVIAQRHAARSALCLLLNFCCLAGLYILLNAQFLAMVQIIIYAGAVVVLFLFVVMLLGVEHIEEKPDPRRYQGLAAGLLAVLLLAGLIWAALAAGPGPAPALTTASNVRQIGAALLTGYAIPFEMAALVLLVAMIGTIVLAKRRL